MGLSHKFSRPLLIYDDKCYSCTKFDKAAGILSRGRIRTVGHYYSKEAIEAKKIIINVNSDPNNMIMLINKKGTYGARTCLVQVAKEIIIGLFKRRDSKSYGNDNDNNNSNPNNLDLACEYKDRMTSCGP